MVSYIVRFSNILSECAPHALETSKLLYTTLFLREAKAKNKVQEILNEFELKWEQRPLSLYTLIHDFFEYYVDLTHPDWSFARNYILGFYSMCNGKGRQSSAYPQNIKIPKKFRPLPSLYYSVQNDIQYFRQNHEERKRAYRKLRLELKAFETRNPGLQCPVKKKYVKLPDSTPPDTVWEVKKEAFAEIFQRTRELCFFSEDAAHFHHAARILDYWQSALERRHEPSGRRDEGAFERQAKDMKKLQRVFVDTLEKMQRNLKMNEVMQFASTRMGMSRDFMSIRTTVAKQFEKMKHLLDDSDHVLPALVRQEASLASSLFASHNERQKVHDDLKRTSEQLRYAFQQVRGWEDLTGTKIFSESLALGHTSNNPPAGQSQPIHSQPTQSVAPQDQHREPHVTSSRTQTINNHSSRQQKLGQLQSRTTRGDVRRRTEPQAIQPQTSNQTSNEEEIQIPFDNTFTPRPASTAVIAPRLETEDPDDQSVDYPGTQAIQPQISNQPVNEQEIQTPFDNSLQPQDAPNPALPTVIAPLLDAEEPEDPFGLDSLDLILDGRSIDILRRTEPQAIQPQISNQTFNEQEIQIPFDNMLQPQDAPNPALPAVSAPLLEVEEPEDPYGLDFHGLVPSDCPVDMLPFPDPLEGGPKVQDLQ